MTKRVRRIRAWVAWVHSRGEDATTARLEVENRFSPLSREEDREMEDAIELHYGGKRGEATSIWSR